jgi:peptidoglycan/xylan/chitin deacetylase (PgdA/CDA1 family)
MLRRVIRAGHRRLTNVWPVKQCVARLTAPVATITFDDFPHSAWAVGAPILERHGVRGTYFVSAAFSPESLRRRPPAGPIEGVRYYDLEDVIAAYAHGHEIGCHSFDHRHAPLQTNVELEKSIRSNASFVRDLLGDLIMTSFAFPQGEVNIRTKEFMGKRFAACRGTWPGINAGVIDLSLLRCVGLEPVALHQHPVKELIDRAKARNGWLIFNVHDVSAVPSRWGCTPELLESVVASLLNSGIEILTLKNALARAAFR